MTTPGASRHRSLERALLWISAVLLVLRVYASRILGYGDGEALYAVYALHPAPSYLDHPGLIGALAGLLGDGGAPTPRTAHAWTAVFATTVPFAVLLSARLAGAPRHRAVEVALVAALTPELAVGLFGFTPDLPLAILWLLCMGLTLFSLRRPRGDRRADAALLAAGVCGGLAAAAKLPGLALLPWIALSATGRRPGLVVFGSVLLGISVVSPVALHEAASGFAMFRHRFVSTQQTAGFSFRNIAALGLGQIGYLSPLVFGAAWASARGVIRRRSVDPVARALFVLFALTAAPLVGLCVWSRVAEPHWVAPAYLPLAVAWGRRPAALPSWLRDNLLRVAAAFVAVVHLYVLTDIFPRLAGASYDGRYDLANDMRMFPAAAGMLRAELLVAARGDRRVVVVAPHWTIAAQLAGVLPSGTLITTAGGSSSADGDFPRWVSAWTRDRADAVLFVSDDRFGTGASEHLTARPTEGRASFTLARGGRPVRRLQLRTLGPPEGAAPP